MNNLINAEFSCVPQHRNFQGFIKYELMSYFYVF